ncbi:MAG: type II toxin-antitoxin system RelE/ParE family toxin [Bacteroidota bacterium]|jgi:mRNA-degrading endonuclease RelE of RelBE toxin-antitoxin system
MVIIETPVFTRRVLDILSDDEYKDLQSFIAANPTAGDIIPGSNGLRKLRWSIQGKGKRGGSRIIYYWVKPKDTVLMLFLFKKNEQSDLSVDQLKRLKSIITQELL